MSSIILLHIKDSNFTAVEWGTMLQAGRSQDSFPIGSPDFSIDLTLPATLWPWGRLSLQQKSVPGIFLGLKGGWHIRLTTDVEY
jgi:hypothetical protein